MLRVEKVLRTALLVNVKRDDKEVFAKAICCPVTVDKFELLI